MSNALRSRTGPKPITRHKCVADGCESISDHPVSGLCHMHYARNRRTGTTSSKSRKDGSGTITSHGYIAVKVGSKKRQQHVLVAEAALEKSLPLGAEVHHVNENRQDNRNENLVVCPSRAYHKLIHTRSTALNECGNAGFRKCPFCKTYDDPLNMKHNTSSRYFYHNHCKSEYRKLRSEK